MLNNYKPHIALLRFKGGINFDSAENFIKRSRKIERYLKYIKGIAFSIDSPGGSLTQSTKIVDFIEGISKRNKIPIYTYADSIAASGGYYLLVCGKKVFVRKDSLVGSIGVINTSFNLHTYYEKYRLERLYLNSGYSEFKDIKNKTYDNQVVTKDPNKDLYKEYDLFQEPKDDILNKEIKILLENFGENFRNYVSNKRNDKLTKDDLKLKSIYNANVYLGSKAVELGLCDEIYHSLNENSIKTNFKNELSNSNNLTVVDYSVASFYERMMNQY
jgi:ClpP class serine protease